MNTTSSTMRSRGNNFSKTEINILLNIIEDVVPIGSEEWKQVETRHRQHYPQLDRSRDTLKRKFRQLCGSRPRTGADLYILCQLSLGC